MWEVEDETVTSTVSASRDAVSPCAPLQPPISEK